MLVADISLWEVAMLVNLGRLRLAVPLRDWLEKATAPPRVRLVPITPAVAAEVASFPDSFHGDPADRILVATARAPGAVLVTSDRGILDATMVRDPRLGGAGRWRYGGSPPEYETRALRGLGRLGQLPELVSIGLVLGSVLTVRAK